MLEGQDSFAVEHYWRTPGKKGAGNFLVDHFRTRSEAELGTGAVDNSIGG